MWSPLTDSRRLVASQVVPWRVTRAFYEESERTYVRRWHSSSRENSVKAAGGEGEQRASASTDARVACGPQPWK